MITEGYLTKAVGGYITTAYMIAYGLGQLISGVIASKVKPAYMIGLGLGGAAICNMAMGLVESDIPQPYIWAANGLFHSMLWSPIIRVFTDLLPSDHRDKAGTHISVSCSAGAVLAFLIPAVVLRFGNWRTVFLVSGAILLVSLLIWSIGNKTLSAYKEMMEKACQAERSALMGKAERDADNGRQQATRKTHRPSLLSLILSSGLWLILFGLFCNGALRDAVESWAPTFLSEQFQLDSSLAALISVVIPVISVTGTYIADWLYRHYIRNEVYTTAVMFAVATLCVGGIYFVKISNVVLCALFMAVSVSAMWGANHMYLTVIPYHFAPFGLSAAVTGFLNSVIYFSTALCSGVYGVLAERVGWNTLLMIWLGIGCAGILFCILGGRLWERKRLETDEGRL